ncbi:MAG: hypothetical protein PW788_07395 [Micavibrio sp.]|nr:hypothetical protein [Micavibrio sp.]
MAYLITQAELEPLTETELRQKYHAILSDLASRNLNIDDCPLAKITLQNILHVLAGKRRLKPLALCF